MKRRRRKLEVDVPKLLRELGVRVRRSGRELRGNCPHPRHPARPGPGSWQIVASGSMAGSHHCYACKWGGGPVALVAAVKGLDNKAAWRWLLEFCGVRAPRGARPKPFRKGKGAPPPLRFPAGSSALWRDVPQELEEARAYVLSRGFRPEELERFRIAGVPDIAPSYAGRVIIPIIVCGEMVDFVARLWAPRPPRIPKALSGRKTEGARKELSLWGYDELDRSLPVVHVAEGVWGAISMIHAGVPNVVAACGSAWSPERTELLRPWERVVLVPDGDPAGAGLEHFASSLRFDHELGVVDLPLGTQPDDFSATEIVKLISSVRPYRVPGALKVTFTAFSTKL